MRRIVGRRFPAVLIVLLAFIGVAVSVVIGRGLAAREDETPSARKAQHDAIAPAGR